MASELNQVQELWEKVSSDLGSDPVVLSLARRRYGTEGLVDTASWDLYPDKSFEVLCCQALSEIDTQLGESVEKKGITYSLESSVSPASGWESEHPRYRELERELEEWEEIEERIAEIIADFESTLWKEVEAWLEINGLTVDDLKKIIMPEDFLASKEITLTLLEEEGSYYASFEGGAGLLYFPHEENVWGFIDSHRGNLLAPAQILNWGEIEPVIGNVPIIAVVP